MTFCVGFAISSLNVFFFQCYWTINLSNRRICLSIPFKFCYDVRQKKTTDTLAFINGSSSSIESNDDDDDGCGQCLKSYSFSLIEFVTYLTQ